MGSFIAYLLAEALFGMPFRFGALTGMLGTHTLVMVVLCFLVWTYAALYDRLFALGHDPGRRPDR